MLAPVRVKVKRRGVSHVAAGFIGNDGDIVAYLALIRIAFEGIKRVAYGHVWRPGHAGIRAKGIE